ncbi:uncharacterized protein LOC122632713 isoform X1 [Vespula pensylvanica]|uniref:Ubiquitin-like protease family profile domain-containing protein n=2 Tax=Vespula pensylvanica TaxID=30213 RepID=A0A834NSM8_VESPE|nr:uncharacterized protein LOC122632713 isoform X1 [Vespula pensylvanica]XP_043675798.1 uncharacterized protein LOC122632713 isoform X1 [Vespula pensylvanica]KAF7417163.1 hypothetical protein H0235_011694 [Vespula pensylvanica]
MAQYYNFVTNSSGTLTLEEVQRICSVEGQHVQVVEDVNNGGNGSQQFLAYTAAQQNNEQTIFCQQTINLGSQISTPQLEQGQNVFIIKTNESSPSQSILKPNTVKVHTAPENIVGVVDKRAIKPSVECNNDNQQIQWMKMQENSVNIDAASKQNTLLPEKSQTAILNKSQPQNNITLPLTVHGNTEPQVYNPESTEKKSVKLYQNKSRLSVNNIQTVSPSIPSDGLNVTDSTSNRIPRYYVSNVKVTSPSFHNKTVNATGQNVTPTLTRQVRASFVQVSPTRPTVPIQMSKNPLRLQHPEMEHLSQRIKQAKLRQLQNDQRSQQNIRKNQVSNMSQKPVQNITATPLQHQQVANVIQQKQLQNITTQFQQLQKQSSVGTIEQKSPHQLQSQLSSPSHNMQTNSNVDSDCILQERGILKQQSSPSQADSEESESIAYLQKVIANPSNTIVQRQIQGNTAKMLVMLPNGEQRLITFDISNDDCTVQDLLEQANITFGGETAVCLVSDSTLGINYIVEAGPGTNAILNEIHEHDSNTSQDTATIGSRNTSRTISSPDENSNPICQNEEAKYVEGKLALCPNCGISSLDFNRCQRCLKKLPEGVKTIPMTVGIQEKKENMLSVNTFYKKNNERNSSAKLEKLERDGSAYKRGRGRGRGSFTSRTTKVINKEPECLTISSDEDEEGKTRKVDGVNSNAVSSNASNNFTEEMETILDKEPVITNNSVSSTNVDLPPNSEECTEGGSTKCEDQNFTDSSTQNIHTTILCRTVRIGSYKYVPPEKILISPSGIRFGIPLLEDDKSFVTLDVKVQDLVKVLVHFGKSMPVIFFYTTTSAGAMIRELLGMQDPKGPYYDPAGKDHTHRRITLLPEKLSDESKVALKNIFMIRKGLLEELNPKEANDILVRASPKDNSLVPGLTRRYSQTSLSNTSTVNGGIQTITVYPPPPAKGGIAINTEDYLCLGEDQFLNDVIIDFYLKYLTLEVLSESDQHRTHVFSSYFYKRLTSPHAQAGESTVPLSAAAKRHARVQKWTKNVNIFEKDFIVIPINEHAHWFLAIICFPGLVGKVTINPKTIKEEDVHKTVQKSKKLKDLKIQAVTIGTTTITPVTTTITIDQGDDGSERDEAEGDDEEMEMDSDDEEETEGQENNKNQETDQGLQNINSVKVPCILIFDSLAGASRCRVVATLRDYLSCEHVAKMGIEKTFSKDTIKGASPKVPQQSNFTDCGLYVLQYVESFFKDPIKDYTLPIKTLKHWFEEIIVTRKREEISKLLTKLMNATKGDKNITLPVVNFPTQDGKLKPKSENHVEIKPVKTEIEIKKKPMSETETTPRAANSTVPAQVENKESSNEVVNKSTYQIIPFSPCTSSSSSTDKNSTEMLVDTKIHTRSPSEIISYLKSKRIPRLMLRTDAQDDSQAAKKHKGEFFEPCK